MVILVIDAVALVRNNLERLLRANGHEVIQCDSCKAALRILKRDQRIELVITEVFIRDMNAVELFKATHEIERISDSGDSKPPEFILFTSLRPDGDLNGTNLRLLHEAVDVGFIDILYKPLVREKLLQHVGRCQDTAKSELPDRSNSTKKIGTAETQSSKAGLKKLEDRLVRFDSDLNEIRHSLRSVSSEVEKIKEKLSGVRQQVNG